jgi:ribosome modulation factor
MKPQSNFGWQSSPRPGESISIRSQHPQAFAMGRQARASGRDLDLCPFWQPYEREAAVRWREGWFHAHIEAEKQEARP